MQQMNKIITIPHYLDIVDVLGVKDANLVAIKKYLNKTKISISDNNDIMLYGPQEEVELVINVFNRIFELLAAKEEIVSDDVDLLMRQSLSGALVPSIDDTIILEYGKKVVRAKTLHQKEYAQSIRDNVITFGIGMAGTSKTFTAAVVALQLLKEKKIKHIVITRPPIAMDGMSIGYLPGSADEKTSPWLAPILQIFLRFMSEEALQEMIAKGQIQIIPLGFLRGYSIRDSVIICDESQNVTVSALKCILTRIDMNTKVVICGDSEQSDLKGNSGLEIVSSILKGLDGVKTIRFDENDIVRSGIVTEVIKRFYTSGY